MEAQKVAVAMVTPVLSFHHSWSVCPGFTFTFVWIESAPLRHLTWVDELLTCLLSVPQPGAGGPEASGTQHPHWQLPDPHLSPTLQRPAGLPAFLELLPPWSRGSKQTSSGLGGRQRWNQVQLFRAPLTLKIEVSETRHCYYIYRCNLKLDVWQVR